MDNYDEVENAVEQSVLVELTADIVSAYVGNNAVTAADLPTLITQVHKALGETAAVVAEPAEEERPEPAVNPKKSVTRDYIICLEDGKKFKSLKRHLSSHYNMSPEEYRKRWDLPSDYPMVAPSYAEKRSQLARQSGLGRKRGK
ncbi:MAG: MucR family transcriptional regulator [Pseudomonadota bacterium]